MCGLPDNSTIPSADCPGYGGFASHLSVSHRRCIEKYTARTLYQRGDYPPLSLEAAIANAWWRSVFPPRRDPHCAHGFGDFRRMGDGTEKLVAGLGSRSAPRGIPHGRETIREASSV
jgi:hypothetical protein